MSNLKKDPKQNYIKISDAVLGVDEDGCLLNFDPALFVGNVDGSVEITYLYSDQELEPLNPDDAVIDVWVAYNLSSRWMAMQEKIGNILMPWKVFRIKGDKGDKGDKGEKGDPGQNGTPGGVGTPGQSSLTSYVFKRSATQPSTPTSGSYQSPVPSGWSDGIPAADGNPVWMSSRLFTSDGLSPQSAAWSVPSKIADSETLDYEFSNFTGTYPGTPSFPLNGATWHDDGLEDDVWMAMRSVKNGVNGIWSVVRVKGENGEIGQSSFTSIVFKRSANNIPITARPTGGTYASPVPTGWSDGIPAGVGSVYQSSRIFSSDGLAPQNPVWSEPALAVDNVYKDYEYSSRTEKPGTPTMEPAAWHNDPLEEDIWQAVRNNDNGVFGPWKIQRIRGEAGEPGLGYTVVSNNPIYSIAVGSDGIASIAKQATVTVNIYRNALLLSPAPTSIDLNDNQFFIVLPTSLPSGITVVKSTDNTLVFSIAAGTALSETKNISIPLIVGSESISMNSVFSVVPITTAEDGLMLVLSASSNVVSFDSANNLITPTSIVFNVNQQNYNETVTWVSDPVGIVSGTGLSKTVDTSTFFNLNSSVKITVSTPNGLFDATTVLKVKDGAGGPPGINGTSGPSPRILELVIGGVYENGEDFIDYAYYRTNDVNEGFYTVKVVGGVRTLVTYTGGVPDPTKFDKSPFTKEMSFGTVIAEQANLAGFIFRNQKLNSQALGTMSCAGVPTQYPNLELDGKQGIIKFLERMVLDKTGIVLNDDCGVRRMAFQWGLSGVPILKFFAADGVTVTWEAGNNGYQTFITTVPESYAPLHAFYKATTPDGSLLEGKAVFTSANMCNVSDIYSPTGTAYYYKQPDGSEGVKGYLYDKGVQPSYLPAQEAGDKKYFTTANYAGTLIPDGWYLRSFLTFTEAGENKTKGLWTEIIGGVEGAQMEVVYDADASLPTCNATQLAQWQTGY